MKKLFIIVILFVFNFSFAQDEMLQASSDEGDDTIYKTEEIEEQPDFPGGKQEFYRYIGKNFKIPNVKGLSGKIVATFVIEKDGKIDEINVVQDLGHGTRAETERVLKKCPYWFPGEQQGKRVRVQYSLPIVIQN